MTTQQIPLTIEAIPQQRALSDFSARFNGVSKNLSDDYFARLSSIDSSILQQLSGCLTGDDVADHLRSKGIKGKRGILETCPLAEFAISCGAKEVQVDNQGVSFLSAIGPLRHASSAVQEFVVRFDNGDYPDLEA
jgi:hypothetical protein